MGMSSWVMDCEDRFVDEISNRIGGCECVDELITDLKKDGCMSLVAHMEEKETYEFISELWNEFWSDYV